MYRIGKEGTGRGKGVGRSPIWQTRCGVKACLLQPSTLNPASAIYLTWHTEASSLRRISAGVHCILSASPTTAFHAPPVGKHELHFARLHCRVAKSTPPMRAVRARIVRRTTARPRSFSIFRGGLRAWCCSLGLVFGRLHSDTPATRTRCLLRCMSPFVALRVALCLGNVRFDLTADSNSSTRLTRKRTRLRARVPRSEDPRHDDYANRVAPRFIPRSIELCCQGTVVLQRNRHTTLGKQSCRRGRDHRFNRCGRAPDPRPIGAPAFRRRSACSSQDPSRRGRRPVDRKTASGVAPIDAERIRKLTQPSRQGTEPQRGWKTPHKEASKRRHHRRRTARFYAAVKGAMTPAGSSSAA